MKLNEAVKQKRIENGLSQTALALSAGVSKQAISQYEKGVINLKIEALGKLKALLNIDEEALSKVKSTSLASMTNSIPLGEIQYPEDESPFIEIGNGQYLMVVPLIPITASAGYRENFSNEEYINENYDKHYFPVTRQYRGKYFAFVVDGDSMDDGTSGAIIEGSTVTGREIQKTHWRNKFHLNTFKDYIIVHKDTIVVKRIIAHDVEKGTITCHSLNPDKKLYADFDLDLNDCLQILNIVNVTQPR